MSGRFDTIPSNLPIGPLKTIRRNISDTGFEEGPPIPEVLGTNAGSILASAVNTSYVDLQYHWFWATQTNGFPADGFVSGFRNGADVVQTLYPNNTRESANYTRSWNVASGKWNEWVYSGFQERYITAAQTTTLIAFADTGLFFDMDAANPVDAKNYYYHFEAFIRANTFGTTSVPRFQVVNSKSVSFIHLITSLPTSATANTVLSTNTLATPAGTYPAAPTVFLNHIEGLVQPTGSGQTGLTRLMIQFAAELAGTQAGIQVGSFIRWKRMIA